jgi:hypothetical protein
MHKLLTHFAVWVMFDDLLSDDFVVVAAAAAVQLRIVAVAPQPGHNHYACECKSMCANQ